jgi:hypothetical protein
MDVLGNEKNIVPLQGIKAQTVQPMAYALLIYQYVKFLTNIILYRSDSSKARMTCVSGSPNLQLNSKTLGPSFVNMRPAYKTPKKQIKI